MCDDRETWMVAAMRRLARHVIAGYLDYLVRFPPEPGAEQDYQVIRKWMLKDGYRYWFAMAERLEIYPRVKAVYVNHETLRAWQLAHQDLVRVQPGAQRQWEKWKEERE